MLERFVCSSAYVSIACHWPAAIGAQNVKICLCVRPSCKTLWTIRMYRALPIIMGIGHRLRTPPAHCMESAAWDRWICVPRFASKKTGWNANLHDLRFITSLAGEALTCAMLCIFCSLGDGAFMSLLILCPAVDCRLSWKESQVKVMCLDFPKTSLALLSRPWQDDENHECTSFHTVVYRSISFLNISCFSHKT